MTIPDSEISRAWITAGASRLWGTKGTYSSVAYDQLPSLPPVDPSFAWLASAPARDYGCTLDSDDNKLSSLPAIEAELGAFGPAPAGPVLGGDGCRQCEGRQQRTDQASHDCR